MRTPLLPFACLSAVAISVGTTLEPWFQTWAGNRQSGSLLQTALGDGRKLFANHFYTKADVYFHNGYYPTIYDNVADFQEAHMAGEVHPDGEEEALGNFLGEPTDWLDALGRHFYPSHHTHLGDSGHTPHHDDDGEKPEHAGAGEGAHGPAGTGDEREILPWLRLSAELDPERVETYVVASYWLRSTLGRVDDAERFLREGLRANPGDHEILFELGRIYYESRRDPVRARNVWELALKRCREREPGQPEPNRLVYGGILNNLAMVEREQNNYPRAIQYYTLLKEVSPNKAKVQEWIDYLKTNGPPVRVGIKEL
jgi:tetratricopeptide (TPR) repeat protein